MNKYINRDNIESELLRFLKKRGAGFVSVRGRRRIGKSELLLHAKKKHKSFFLFRGYSNEATRKTIRRFIEEFRNHDSSFTLSQYDPTNSWDKVFEEIHERAKQASVCIGFDEIQWISKKGAGFEGSLKAAWENGKKQIM